MSKAFTIIELLMALLIIGLLAGAITVGVNNSQMKSRDSRRVSDLQLLKKATGMYFVDRSAYPPHNDVANPTQSVSGYNCGMACTMARSLKVVAGVRVDNPTWGSIFVVNQYLNSVPYDPKNTNIETFVDANVINFNSPAYYAYVVGSNSYKFFARLEQNANLVGDDGGTVNTGSNYDSKNIYEVGDGAGWQALTP